eukprot:3641338-Prymnesium_polylepis.2
MTAPDRLGLGGPSSPSRPEKNWVNEPEPVVGVAAHEHLDAAPQHASEAFDRFAVAQQHQQLRLAGVIVGRAREAAHVLQLRLARAVGRDRAVCGLAARFELRLQRQQQRICEHRGEIRTQRQHPIGRRPVALLHPRLLALLRAAPALLLLISGRAGGRCAGGLALSAARLCCGAPGHVDRFLRGGGRHQQLFVGLLLIPHRARRLVRLLHPLRQARLFGSVAARGSCYGGGRGGDIGTLRQSRLSVGLEQTHPREHVLQRGDRRAQRRIIDEQLLDHHALAQAAHAALVHGIAALVHGIVARLVCCQRGGTDAGKSVPCRAWPSGSRAPDAGALARCRAR